MQLLRSNQFYKNSDVLWCVAVFLVLLISQWYKAMALAPLPENIWDNVYLWDWARSVSQGDFSAFIPDSHHQMRWGNWTFAALLIEFFGDEIVVHYLATLIPSTLAALLFTYLTWRYVGVVAALAFIVLWHTDALLFRATFQLLPSGAALLPVAITLALCIDVVKTQSISFGRLMLLSVVVVWLYGTKETHLAYLPAILFIVYRAAGFRAVATIAMVFCGAYVLETLMFKMMSGAFPWLGRIYSVVDGGQHVELMKEHAHYVGQQTRYFDSGITMRWVLTSGVTPIPIFIGFIFALFLQTKIIDDVRTALSSSALLEVLALFIISFIVCNTFFIISIDPIRLGQPLVARYATTLMPLVYMMCIAYAAMMASRSSWVMKVGLLAIIPFYIAPAIDRITKYPEASIVSISKQYSQFAKDLEVYECVRARQRVIVMNELDLVPSKYRDDRLNILITQDQNVVDKDGWVVAKTVVDKECQSMYTIQRNDRMRY